MPYPYYPLQAPTSPYTPAPYNLSTPPQNAFTAASGGLLWVQGENGAKSYIVAPNSTVLLMDSESQKFYIKSVDASGMPKPLRTFEYTEVGVSQPVEYVTKAEFEKAIAELAPRKAAKKDE